MSGYVDRWTRAQLVLMREVFTRAGWRVSGAGSVRGMKAKVPTKGARRAGDYRYFEQPL